MPRPKGSVNKITTEVKEQLENLIDEVMNRIDVDAIDFIYSSNVPFTEY